MEIDDVLKRHDYRPRAAAQLVILPCTRRLLPPNPDHRPDTVLHLAAYVQNAGARRAAEPFVGIAGEAVHSPVRKAELDHPGGVSAIHEAKNVLAAGKLCEFLHGHKAPVPAKRVREVHHTGPRSD